MCFEALFWAKFAGLLGIFPLSPQAQGERLIHIRRLSPFIPRVKSPNRGVTYTVKINSVTDYSLIRVKSITVPGLRCKGAGDMQTVHIWVRYGELHHSFNK